MFVTYHLPELHQKRRTVKLGGLAAENHRWYGHRARLWLALLLRKLFCLPAQATLDIDALFQLDGTSLWNRNHSHLCTNLVATLACLKVNDFPHFGRNVKVPNDVSQKLLPLWRFSNRRTNLPEKVGDTVNYSRQINAIGRAICQSKHNRLLIRRVNTVSCFDWLVLRWHRCLGNTKKNSIHNSVSAETRLIYLQRGV